MLLSYALARTRFLRSFEPEGNGYIYRRRPHSEGFRVSDEERDEFLRAFRRRYVLHQLYLIAGIFVLFGLVFAIIMVFPQVSDAAMTGFTLVLAATLVGWIVVHQRHLYDIPVISLAGRPAAVAGQTKAEFRDSYIRRASWQRSVVSAIILAGLAWLTFPWPQTVWWMPVAWLGFFALCFGLMIRNVLRKFALEKRDQIGPEL